MSQDTYSLLLRGYDVLIEPSEDEDSYHVSVSDGGAPWEMDMPVDLDELAQLEAQDDEDLDGSDALMQFVGNAAVDLYESQKGTLGQGAPAPEVTAMSLNKVIKKRGYYDSLHWEDWFMRLKGTPFEEEAAGMLEEYFNLSTGSGMDNSDYTGLYEQEEKLNHELNMLNLERMKTLPSGQTVIYIQGAATPKHACWDADRIQEYMDRFAGCPQEAEALAKIRELLDVRDQIAAIDVSGENMWEQQSALEGRMLDLQLQSLQQNVQVPTGMDSAPNMAGDLAELMEGVDLHAPLDDQMDEPFVAARVAFDEVEPADERVEEVNYELKGIDPAEVDEVEEEIPQSFNTNDYVELKEEITQSGPGWGGSTTYPAGTRGYAESQYDRFGNRYVVRTEDGRALIVVRWDQLKLAPRSRKK